MIIIYIYKLCIFTLLIGDSYIHHTQHRGSLQRDSLTDIVHAAWLCDLDVVCNRLGAVHNLHDLQAMDPFLDAQLCLQLILIQLNQNISRYVLLLHNLEVLYPQLCQKLQNLRERGRDRGMDGGRMERGKERVEKERGETERAKTDLQ